MRLLLLLDALLTCVRNRIRHGGAVSEGELERSLVHKPLGAGRVDRAVDAGDLHLKSRGKEVTRHRERENEVNAEAR